MADERFEILRRSIIEAPVIMKGEYPYFIHPLSDGVPIQSAELLAAARDLINENVDWSKVAKPILLSPLIFKLSPLIFKIVNTLYVFLARRKAINFKKN